MLLLVTFHKFAALLKGGCCSSTHHLQQESVYSSAVVGFVLDDCISFQEYLTNYRISILKQASYSSSKQNI